MNRAKEEEQAGFDSANCSSLLTLSNVVYMDHPEEMLKPWKSNPLFFEIVTVHVITFIFGLCGNAIVVGVLTGNRKSRTATNSFLVSLAAGDLLMLCIYGSLETYAHFVIDWDESGTICKTAKFAEFLSATSSVLNLLAVTIERFLVIVFPVKSRTLCTSRNTLRAIVGVWFLSFTLALPILTATETYRITFTNNVSNITLNYCNHSINSPAFVIYQFFVIFCIPGVLMAICYTLVIKELWASTRKMDVLTNGFGTKSQMRKSSKRVFHWKENRGQGVICQFVASNKDEINAARRQVIKMLVLVIFLFYISWGPRLTMDILQKLQMVPFTQDIYLLRIIFNLITFFHSCINPFIYSFMSKKFRSYLLRYLDKSRCGRLLECFGSRKREDYFPKMLQRKRENSIRNEEKHESRKPRCSQCSYASSDARCTEMVTVQLYGGDESAISFSTDCSCRLKYG